jgi:hypothetical protein
MKNSKKGGVLHMRDIEELDMFDIYNKSPLYRQICKIYTFNDKNFMDHSWLSRQMDYINGLSDFEKRIVYTYTIYGDKLANKYIRGILTESDICELLETVRADTESPFWSYSGGNITRENIIQCIEKYIRDFNPIILGAPRPVKPIKVFRGIRDGQYIINGMKKNQYKNEEFISTSFYVESATRFTDGQCCLLELTLNPGVPCLFTGYVSRRRAEYEITLGLGSIMDYKRCYKKLVLNSPEFYEGYDIFMKSVNYNIPTMNVCEFIIKP